MLSMLMQNLGRKAKLGKVLFTLVTTTAASAISYPALASPIVLNTSPTSLFQTTGLYLVIALVPSLFLLSFFYRSKS